MYRNDMEIPGNPREDAGTDRLTGFLGDLVLAMLASFWGVWLLEIFVFTRFEFSLGANTGLALRAGLFVGVMFADPVGAILNKDHFGRVLLRALAGCALGAALQYFVVTPLAGNRVSLFVFLALSIVYLPLMLLFSAATTFLEKKGIRPSVLIVKGALAFLRLPRPAPLGLAFLLALPLFWQIGPSFSVSLVVLLAAAGFLLAQASFGPPFEVEVPLISGLDDPKDKPTLWKQLLREAGRFCLRNAAGVAFYSALIWLTFGLLPATSLFSDAQTFAESWVGESFVTDFALKTSAATAGVLLFLIFGRLLLSLTTRCFRRPRSDTKSRLRFFIRRIFFRG